MPGRIESSLIPGLQGGEEKVELSRSTIWEPVCAQRLIFFLGGGNQISSRKSLVQPESLCGPMLSCFEILC